MLESRRLLNGLDLSLLSRDLLCLGVSRLFSILCSPAGTDFKADVELRQVIVLG